MEPLNNDQSTNDESLGQSTSLPVQAADHPLYLKVESLISQGNWQAARAPFDELLSLYPDDPYLQELAPSVRTRSALLGYAEATTDASTPRFKPTGSLKFLIGGLVVLVILCLIGGGVVALRLWILPETSAQQMEVRVTELKEEAQAGLESGDYDRAVVAYTEILQIVPDDQEAQEGLEQARQLRSTISLYSEAIAEMEAHHWDNALSLFQQIEAVQPEYRDVAERIEFVEQQRILERHFSEAEAAFSQANYKLAIQEYETLRSIDSNFQSDTVQDHLFFSYLQQGLAEETAAGRDPQGLQAALEIFEKALALRPGDSQINGERQLLSLYLDGLEEIEDEKWSVGVANLTLVYDARPDFAAASVGPLLRDAYLAWGDELFDDEQFEEAQAKYEAARAVKGVDTANVGRKIALAKAAQATPTPTPTPEPIQSSRSANSSGGGSSAPPPTPTPIPMPYALKSMAVRNNCSGNGYIHGVVWNAYNMPVSGVTIQAFNIDNGTGPIVSNPTNGDGIYQIIINGDQIPGLWMVQVLENGQPVSDAMGQRLGGECLNGAQELKADWQRTELQLD